MSGFGNADARRYTFWGSDARPSLSGIPSVEFMGTFDIDSPDFILIMTPADPAKRGEPVGFARLSRREAVFLRNALTSFIELPVFEQEERERIADERRARERANIENLRAPESPF